MNDIGEEGDFLLRSLDDLEREHAAGDIDDVDYVALRDGYTTRAAAVLRGQATPANTTPQRRGRTWMIAALVLAAATGGGVAVARSAGQRSVGGGLTGAIGQSTASLLAQARADLGTDRAKATSLYDQVLQVDPRNVEALTYKAWVERIETRAKLDSGAIDASAASARFTEAQAGLDAAIAIDPAVPDALCFVAVMRFRDFADSSGARAALDRCLAANPSQQTLALTASIGPEIDSTLANSGDSAAVFRVQLAEIKTKAIGAKTLDELKLAIDSYDALVVAHPDSAEALAYGGWYVALLANQLTGDARIKGLSAGEAKIDRALVVQPAFGDALCFKAIVHATVADAAGALASAQACQAAGPPASAVAIYPDLAASIADIVSAKNGG